MVNPASTVIAVTSSGVQPDSAAETRRRQRGAAEAFRAESGENRSPQSGSQLQKTRDAGPASGPLLAELLRRRTDRGEAADPAIEIPPHLERRRAWREAFGVNTYHAQQLAQADAPEAGGEAPSSAHSAYRSAARRGRLDLDLAQQVSMTV
jgi:hypothetical protein